MKTEEKVLARFPSKCCKKPVLNAVCVGCGSYLLENPRVRALREKTLKDIDTRWEKALREIEKENQDIWTIAFKEWDRVVHEMFKITN